jgi:Phage tail tube protein
MTVADGSQTRLGTVTETVINTIPTTPIFQTMRYLNSDVRLTKQTDTPNEIRADRNVGSIVDVGRSVAGTIRTLYSYGTYHTWLEYLLCNTWATNAIKNGVLHQAATTEFFFEQGAVDTFVRYRGTRWNTLDLTLRPRQSVTADWGIMGTGSPTPTAAIIAGATYLPPTTTEVLNAGLNVAALDFTGIVTPPKIQALTLRITNNIYPIDVVGQYEVYAHGLGRFEATGSITALFESMDTYSAILDHRDVTIGFMLTDAAGNSELWTLGTCKLNDGGPTVPGNNAPVVLEVPFQAKYDVSDTASITIVRTPV